MKRSNGEGTIFKRNDGRWCGAFYDDSPNPRRHFVYGKTQTEVKKKLKEARENPIVHSKIDNARTLEKWVDFYLQNYKKNEVKQTTLDFYMRVYRKHIQGSNIGKMKLEKISADCLQEFYNMKREVGYNAKTIRHIYIVINIALAKAEQLKYISANPNRFVTLPKIDSYTASVLSADEVNIIFEKAKDDEIYPIVALTLCTGLRLGEVMALKWSNIDFENRELYIEGSLCRVEKEQNEQGRIIYEYIIMEPKTRKSRRILPLIDRAVEALLIQKNRQERMKEDYTAIYNDQDFVFTQQNGDIIKQRQFEDSYHDFLRRYGVSDVRFHDLRHTFASLLLEAGESPKIIQELLGHSNISTTMDIYTHITKKNKIKTLEAFNSLISNETGKQ